MTTHPHFEDGALAPNELVNNIVRSAAQMQAFWSAAHGWAPPRAAEMLASARLDWLVSLSRALRHRIAEVASSNEPAALIVAWAHLRSLVEGNLKLYLAVFIEDYYKDSAAQRRRGEIVPPDELTLERIRKFLKEADLLVEHQAFIATVQSRGNAIHSFSTRDLGTPEEYLHHVELFLDFLADLQSSLPMPD